MIPRATYRIQFHKGFTFADAEAVVPYLADLGISHLYASPVTVAQPGSTHGYDVVDPTRINPELGGEEAFRSLAAALKARGMGAIVDIVPNHMGVAGSANAWWQDVLAKGRASRYARFFDIDWEHELLLPFLGEPLPQALEHGALELRRDQGGLAVWAYGTHRFPLRPEDQGVLLDTDLTELLGRQHYRLAWWRTANDDLHWRRFFTITELAGLRAEDSEVFEETHRLYFRLFDEGLIDGVRIDHVDGLTDPAAYLERLRGRMPGAYIVVEKILARGERMPPWPVEGTSGYDFMEEVSALLHEPSGEAPLTELWADLSGRPADFHAEELEARRDMLAWEFEGQLAACVRAFAALAASAEETEAYTAGMLRRAVRTMLWVFPVYRTYGTGSGAPATDAAVRETVRERAAAFAAPGEIEVIDAILAWLGGTGPADSALAVEAVRRVQQLSAPIAAKAVEDTAFYRYGRLLSRNDVGFDPHRFSIGVAAFHTAMRDRTEALPHSMLATATHDHKRGEDVRARLAVLSELPGEWAAAVERWQRLTAPAAEGLDKGDVYQFFQTVVGAWPSRLAVHDRDGLHAFGERLAAWQQKALREAKLRSSWVAPDETYEGDARRLIESVLADVDLVADIAAFAERIRPAGEASGLVQAFLRCTTPGVPDLYQGTEFADLSLVDPDNRRPVDFAARRAALTDQASGFDGTKQRLIADLLRLRREEPDIFSSGSYEPLEVVGPRSGNIVAFARRHGGKLMGGAAAIRCASATAGSGRWVPPREWWGDTRLMIPPGVDFPEAASEMFADSPVRLTRDGRNIAASLRP